LVGNRLGRNTSFLKKKILLDVFKSFYGVKNTNNLKKNLFLNLKKYSKYSNFLTNILSFFEQRLDVVIFRVGFVFSVFLARLTIIRGFLRVNFYTVSSPHYRVTCGDFVFFNNIWFRSSVFNTKYEKYNSFKKIILGRFYKPYHFEFLSSYLYSLVSSIFQMSTLKV